MGIRTIASLFALSLFATSPAVAADDARAKAQQIYAQGATAFKAKKYATALEAFNEAYLLDPVPVLLYNIGRAHEELGHFEDARKFFQRYLDRVPDAPDRAQVEQRLALLTKAADAQADAVKARAEADRARADAAEARGVDGSTAVGGGDTTAWVLVAVGGALVATGVGFYFAALSSADEAGDLPATAEGRKDYGEFEDSVRAKELVAWSGIGVGAAAIAGGVFLLLSDDAPVSIGPAPGGFVLGGRF